MTMHRICALNDLADGAAAKFEVGKHIVAVVRIGDQVYAIGNRCSHADVALADGDVYCDTKQLSCIRHGSAFSLETGVPSTLPATQPVPVFVAEVRGADVFVSDQPTMHAASPDPRVKRAQP
jgi:3-phenylpropionate/trans-cinnamate dioxygenase ferredoxin component